MKKVKPLGQRVRRFVMKRNPAEPSVTLTQKRIFILPTLAGIVFLLVSLLVLLLAINYQNNLAYAVCFFMLSLFISSIIHTYVNVSGLIIEALNPSSVFPGEMLSYRYRLKSPRDMWQLSLGFEDEFFESPVDLKADKDVVVGVAKKAVRRGWQSPPLLKITSRYPLGLFRVWSWVQLEQRALIYPQPVKMGELEDLSGELAGQETQSKAGDEDFKGLQEYQPGESIKRIAWKSYAKGQGVLVKTYEGSNSQGQWLDINGWPDLTLEQKLSGMCYWALKLSKDQVAYGLKLDDVILDPESSEKHRDLVLRELALYGIH